MRLCDHVAQASDPVLIEDSAGLHRLPGAEVDASELRVVPLRYALDENALNYCMRVLALDRAMFVPENMALRMIAPKFWLEWQARPADLGGRVLRSGVLVDSSSNGRSGSLRSYWMAEGGTLDRGQALVRFDLDRCLELVGGNAQIRPSTDELGELAGHVAAQVDPEWMHYLMRAGAERARAAQRQLAAPLWCDLAFTFLFSSVLVSRVFSSREITMDRLNAARSKRGREPLLDHVEVRLTLGKLGKLSQGDGTDGHRAVPRLHFVRGHMVRRAGKQFWRCSHMRGDLGASPLIRTVRVTAGD